MVYEARHAKKNNLALAAACVALSIIGFAAAGVIPTQSGVYPLTGWAIVAGCFVAAAEFVRRALSARPLARIDAAGVRARGTILPWEQITGVELVRAGVNRIIRFERQGGRPLGINATHYNPGMDALVATVRHYRPELLPQ